MPSKLNRLLRDGRNVFNIDDLGLVWGQQKRSDTVQSARNYAKRGDLHRLRRGLYALDSSKARREEVASRAWTPSYITGETALALHGLIFPASNEVHSASPRAKRLAIGNTAFIYHQLKEAAFYNPLGIEQQSGYAVASLERAIADLVYIYGGRYYFERLDSVDWDKLGEIGHIYGTKTVVKRIESLRRQDGLR